MKKYIFLDTETTGLNAYSNQILQLSYIITDKNLNIINAKNFYIDPDTEIEPGASAVHGITKKKIQELSRGKKFKDIAGEVFEDINNAKIICHNTKFDLSFLKKEFAQLDKSIKTDDNFCTMQYYTSELRIKNYYGYKWPKLSEVVNYLALDKLELIEKAKEIYNTNEVDYHDSRFDVYVTYVIYSYIYKNQVLEIEKILNILKEEYFISSTKLIANDELQRAINNNLNIEYEEIVPIDYKIDAITKNLNIISKLLCNKYDDKDTYEVLNEEDEEYDDDIPF